METRLQIITMKYEYRVVDYDMFDGEMADGMNYMGDKGWDVIRILDPMSYVNSEGMFIRIFYKRTKQQP